MRDNIEVSPRDVVRLLQMEASSQSRVGGGLWNHPRPTQYSKETQDIVRLMMQEAGLDDFRRNQINDCLKNGTALPRTSHHAVPAPPPRPKSSKSVQKSLDSMLQRRRSAESCRSGDSYIREQFCPGPTRDLEKEKRRLQNIFATGQEEPTAAQRALMLKNVHKPEVVEKDRFQEVLDEIEERRQFLAHMTSLGRQRDYITIINTEISLKIRELELLDKARSARKDAVTSERKELTAEQTNMNMYETGGGRLTVTD
ncbi:UPF0193 protein EVG1 isoform 2-T2 [Acanthopagrus schlegelii]